MGSCPTPAFFHAQPPSRLELGFRVSCGRPTGSSLATPCTPKAGTQAVWWQTNACWLSLAPWPLLEGGLPWRPCPPWLPRALLASWLSALGVTGWGSVLSLSSCASPSKGPEGGCSSAEQQGVLAGPPQAWLFWDSANVLAICSFHQRQFINIPFFFFFNVMSPLLLAQRPGLLLGRGGSSLQPWAEARVRVLLQ